MNEDQLLAKSFFQSTIWIILASLLFMECLIMTLTQLNILLNTSFELLLIVVVGLVSVVEATLAFSLSQCFQALLMIVLARRFGRGAAIGLLAALPLTALITWYSFNYLTPSIISGFFQGPDSGPFEHGLTVVRYVKTLAIQAPVTLFSLFFWDAERRDKPKRPIVLITLALVMLIGGVLGYVIAENRFNL